MEAIGVEALLALGAWYERYKRYLPQMPELEYVFYEIEQLQQGDLTPKGQEAAIYALIDPRDRRLRYIGMTGRPTQRLKEHVAGDEANQRKQEWMIDLVKAGLRPIMRILEVLPTYEQALEREDCWIQACIQAGLDILNAEAAPVARRLAAAWGAEEISAYIRKRYQAGVSRTSIRNELRAAIPGGFSNRHWEILKSICDEIDAADRS